MGRDFRRYLLIVSPFISLVSIALFLGFLSRPLQANIGGTIHVQPSEPIRFDHSVHAGQAGIDCTFCHRETNVGGMVGAFSAGIPDVQQCMFCHSTVAQSTVGAPGFGLDTAAAQREIDAVRQAWQQQKSIDWQRAHRMPDHVRFIHEPHILRGFQCAECHGDVATMGQVVQVRALNMGDCLNCHRQNSAPTECATCHK
jgi:hypothetical protein